MLMALLVEMITVALRRFPTPWTAALPGDVGPRTTALGVTGPVMARWSWWLLSKRRLGEMGLAVDLWARGDSCYAPLLADPLVTQRAFAARQRLLRRLGRDFGADTPPVVDKTGFVVNSERRGRSDPTRGQSRRIRGVGRAARRCGDQARDAPPGVVRGAGSGGRGGAALLLASRRGKRGRCRRAFLRRCDPAWRRSICGSKPRPSHRSGGSCHWSAAGSWIPPTGLLALVAECGEEWSEGAWRDVLFAISGIRHSLANDERTALGPPVLLALTADEGHDRRLLELLETLAREFVLFGRMDVSLVSDARVFDDGGVCCGESSIMPWRRSCPAAAKPFAMA